MPKMTMEWDLTKDDFLDEQEDFDRCVQAKDLCACIEDLRELLSKYKTQAEQKCVEFEDQTTTQPIYTDSNHWELVYDIHDEMINEYFSILEDHGINMDKLWS